MMLSVKKMKLWGRRAGVAEGLMEDGEETRTLVSRFGCLVSLLGMGACFLLTASVFTVVNDVASSDTGYPAFNETIEYSAPYTPPVSLCTFDGRELPAECDTGGAGVPLVGGISHHMVNGFVDVEMEASGQPLTVARRLEDGEPVVVCTHYSNAIVCGVATPSVFVDGEWYEPPSMTEWTPKPKNSY